MTGATSFKRVTSSCTIQSGVVKKCYQIGKTNILKCLLAYNSWGKDLLRVNVLSIDKKNANNC